MRPSGVDAHRAARIDRSLRQLKTRVLPQRDTARNRTVTYHWRGIQPLTRSAITRHPAPQIRRLTRLEAGPLGPERRQLRPHHPGAGRPRNPVSKSERRHRHKRRKPYVTLSSFALIRHLCRNGTGNHQGTGPCRRTRAEPKGSLSNWPLFLPRLPGRPPKAASLFVKSCRIAKSVGWRPF
jgi:hypothetical protein